MGRSSRLWADEGDEGSLLGPNAPTEAQAMLKDPAIRLAIPDDFAQPIRWLADREQIRTSRGFFDTGFERQRTLE